MPVDARARFFTNKQGFGQAALRAGAVFRLSPMIYFTGLSVLATARDMSSENKCRGVKAPTDASHG
jgi:hypothetical protein